MLGREMMFEIVKLIFKVFLFIFVAFCVTFITGAVAHKFELPFFSLCAIAIMCSTKLVVWFCDFLEWLTL